MSILQPSKKRRRYSSVGALDEPLTVDALTSEAAAQPQGGAVGAGGEDRLERAQKSLLGIV
jgi:hypothetical protein